MPTARAIAAELFFSQKWNEYFMTTMGVPTDLSGLGQIEFVPASNSQQYIRALEHDLASVDGQPIFLVHDEKTSTSENFISDAETHLQMKDTLEGTALLRLFQRLADSNITFRIWWADDGPDAHSRVTNFSSLSELLSTINTQMRKGQFLYVRYSG